ncbi:MAG: hypothetical protein GTO14_21610 [Anaerolineales bacterium]|nr:hypothetical protein [Anaerolineales bacterium]
MDTWSVVILAVIAIAFILLWRRAVQARWDLDRETSIQIQELEGSVQALKAERTWPKAAAESTQDLLLVVDHELKVCYANPAAVRVFGELAERVTTMEYTRDLEIEQLVSDAIEVHATDGLERVIHMEDRSYRTCAMVFSEGVSLSLSDISEVHRLNHARQDMVTNLSHELRTPLSSMRQLTGELSSQAEEDPEVTLELVEKIASEVDTIEQITSEILDQAAIDSGRQTIRLMPILLSDVVKDPVVRLADQAKRKEQRILVEITSDLKVLADSDQAARAVRNVLDNAIKFTPQGEEIHITAHKEDEEGMVVLSIQDSGPGLDPDDLERVFERFYRGDHQQESPGTGLGLALARQILRAHGGRIWAENRAPPEKGAIIYFAFQPA